MTDPVFLALERSVEFPSFDQLPALRAGDVVVLGTAEARHALGSKRLRPGETVDLVNGLGLRLRGTVSDPASVPGLSTGTSKDRLVVQVCEVVQETAAVPEFTLVQALAKQGRDEQAVEAATEIGVAQVIPWQAERCVVQWRAGKTSKEEKGHLKWQNLVESAVKQSRQAFLPQVGSLVDTAQLATLVSQWAGRGGVVFLLHEAATERLSVRLEQLRQQAPAKIMVIVGPEGGISADETQQLRRAGAQVLRLGPTVLRSSTAGPAALAVLSAVLGKWDVATDTLSSGSELE